MKNANLLTLVAAVLFVMASVSNLHAQEFVVDPGRLPGPDASWDGARPEPLKREALASPGNVAPIPTVNGQTEGARFIASLPAAERSALLRDTYVLIPSTSDMESAQGDDDSVKGFIRALAIFEQPKQTAMNLMFEPEKLALFLSDLDAAKTVRREDGLGELTKFSVAFLWWDIDFWIQHWFYPELGRYEWFIDKKHFENDIEFNAGFWQLYALDATRTVGEYGVQVDTGIPIPRRMFERIQRRAIPGALDQFQKYINSNGTYRKD